MRNRNDLPGLDLPGKGIPLPGAGNKIDLSEIGLDNPNLDKDKIEDLDEMDIDSLDEEEYDLVDMVEDKSRRSSRRRVGQEYSEDLRRDPLEENYHSKKSSNMGSTGEPITRNRINNRRTRDKCSISPTEKDTDADEYEDDGENYEPIEKVSELEEEGNKHVNGKEETGREIEGRKGSPITFFQSIILMILAGIILLTVVVYGYKAVEGMDPEDIHEDIVNNIKTLEGEGIKEGTNMIWDSVREIEKEGYVEKEIILPYRKERESGKVYIEYDEFEINVDIDLYNFDFGRKGDALVEIIQDKEGNLLSYNVLEVD